jgi:tRNA threonylcarbamoyladenosine modification (KEOPS) complex  Pcc1 subunit
MKIKAKMEMRGKNTDLIIKALMPDNMNIRGMNMNAVVKDKRENHAVTYFEADKVGSLIASVDDYLMNAKVAVDIINIYGKGKDRKG